MTNLEACAKAVGVNELEMLLGLVESRWQLHVLIKRGQCKEPEGWCSIEEQLKCSIEWCWQENDDPELEIGEAKGSA